MKEKILQTRILYPTRLSFRFEGKIKSFIDKQKLRIHKHYVGFIRNVKGREDQDGKGVGRGGHLHPTDTSKIHLHVERLSQNIH